MVARSVAGRLAAPRPEILHKLANHLRLAQHLCEVQGHIRGGHPFPDGTRQIDSHDIRREEIDRLTKHAGLRLDPTHTPANNAQTIDHRGV